MSCSHRGTPVKVGSYTIFAGGTLYLEPGDLRRFGIIIPLTSISDRPTLALLDPHPRKFVHRYPLQDFGGVPLGWNNFVQEMVIAWLENRKRVITFCAGGHGRTGTLLASLVAILEPETEDPIAAVRERYCSHAVETQAQAEAVFALKAKPLPEKYKKLY